MRQTDISLYRGDVSVHQAIHFCNRIMLLCNGRMCVCKEWRILQKNDVIVRRCAVGAVIEPSMSDSLIPGADKHIPFCLTFPFYRGRYYDNL